MKLVKKTIYTVTIVMALCGASPVIAADENSSSGGVFQRWKEVVVRAIGATVGQGKDFKMLFTRGQGYWSNPKDETNKDFFNRLAEPVSQRENWYEKTNYISEFWCSVSNFPLIYVGLKHKSPEVVFAGLASLAYHSCPKQWLLYLDRIGVAVAFSKFLREYKVAIDNPKLLALPPAVLAVNLADVYLGRYKGHAWSHVAWHCFAAWAADVFLSHVKKVS